MIPKTVGQFIKEHNCEVYVKDVAIHFKVHVFEAHRYLEEFIKGEKEAGNNNWTVRYVLTGFKKDTNQDYVKIQRFMIIEEDELEKFKGYFNEITDCKIRSIKPNIEYSIDETQPNVHPLVIKHRDQLTEFQKITFIVNETVSFRKKYLKQIEQIMELDENYGNIDEKETPRSSTTETFFSKNDCPKNKTEDSQLVSSGLETFTSEQNINLSEIMYKSAPTEKSTISPSRNETDSESDENIVMEDVSRLKSTTVHSKKRSRSSKKEKKQHKRIRFISDSDSDEDETILNKVDEKPILKIQTQMGPMSNKEVDEIYQDEEGYLVTEKIRKCLPTIIEPSKEEIDVPENSKSEKSQDKKEKTPIVKPRKNKKIEGQGSIMNFFKPAARA